MHPAHQVRAPGLRGQMEMILHQHKTENGHREPLRGLLQKLQKKGPVAFRAKDALPIIAASAQMIR